MTTTPPAAAREGAAADPWAATIRGKPAPGAVAERTRRTSMQDVEMFAAMTGDRNPLHFDADLAAGAGFVVVIAGNMMRMPGLGREPQAVRMDVDGEGNILGLR